MQYPETWAVVAYFVLVAMGALFSLAEWRGLPSMWHFPKSNYKRGALGVGLSAVGLMFNHLSKGEMYLAGGFCFVCLVYGFSDYLIKEQRNVAAFCFWVLVLSTPVTCLMWYFWQNASRAYVHVDSVAIRIEPLPNIPTTLPFALAVGNLVAYVEGHNVSASVPTLLNPKMRTCIKVRPYINGNVEEEEGMFSDPYCFGSNQLDQFIAGAFNHVLNPSQQFQLVKKENLGILDAQNGDPGFGTFNKIVSAEDVIYVLTKATYADSWGSFSDSPYTRSCHVFISDRNGHFSQSICWGNYQP
jgi:hypothetical protein